MTAAITAVIPVAPPAATAPRPTNTARRECKSDCIPRDTRLAPWLAEDEPRDAEDASVVGTSCDGEGKAARPACWLVEDAPGVGALCGMDG